MSTIPERDIEFLEDKGYAYTLTPYAGGHYLVISNFPIPEQYVPRQSDLLINILTGYPNTPLDMFWTIPDVKLVSGTLPDRSDVYELHNGANWQRWSRHYDWRLGVDNLRTFISAIIQELAKGR